ncbi:hypothetical protein CIB84_008309, partial [Bambusicola thoracicus]
CASCSCSWPACYLPPRRDRPTWPCAGSCTDTAARTGGVCRSTPACPFPERPAQLGKQFPNGLFSVLKEGAATTALIETLILSTAYQQLTWWSHNNPVLRQSI